MDETPQMVQPARRGASQDPGTVALQIQLEATQAALAEETRRRENAQAAWAEEIRGHEATRDALADEVREHAATRSALLEERRQREAFEAAAVIEAERHATVALAADEVVRAARGVLRARTAALAAAPAATPGVPVAARLASVLDLLGTAPQGDSAELARRFTQVREHLADVT